ncbi:MFS transporter [Streptomyces marispadix]|uniref:MFS transporter n=1 Tax=Streptomyces marispadix TaxID=2922868 RepID=A0ABS9T2U5_9ACTN|nr:MFS transporter [Streptomyces marispadix]MCH6162591.1 MFS transporter [Streptomyces marispadix]
MAHTELLAARLERLPWTSHQRKLLLVVATAWLFDSIDLATLTFVLSPISTEFRLDHAQTGLMGSIGFLGMLVGAVVAGTMADRLGRRLVFQCSIVVWGVASVALALSWDFSSLLTFRFLLGLGMGAEFPVAAALMAEFLPADRRGRGAALLEGAWPVGFVLAGALAYVVTEPLGWRGMFVIEGCLAVWALVIRRVLPESPRWLATRGRRAEAEKVLTGFERAVQRAGGKPLPEPAPVAAAASGAASGGFRDLFSSSYRRRTVALWAVWFCTLLGYYGLTTWLGQLLTERGLEVVESIEYILLMALWGIPGFLSAAYLVERIGRKPCLAGYTVASAGAAFAYGQAGDQLQLIVTGSVLQFFLFGMWSSIYAYTPELFPTRSRGVGVGTATAAGRLGAVLGPLLVPVVLSAAGATAVFALGAGLFLTAACLVLTLLPETKHAVLEDISG